MVKFFDFREGNVDYLDGISCLVHHGWQAVERLGAKDHIDKGRSFDDGVTFLAGDTAANANFKIGVFGFQFFPAP